MNRILFASLVSILLLTQNLQAEVQPFGRIFTSDEEREKLNRIRNQGEDIQAQHGPAVSKISHKKFERIEFSGYVLDDKGKSVIWVNGKSDLTGSGTGVITSAPKSNRDDIHVIYEGRREKLKPGQVWLIDNGVVKEVYELPPERKVKPLTQAQTYEEGGSRGGTKVSASQTKDVPSKNEAKERQANSLSDKTLTEKVEILTNIINETQRELDEAGDDGGGR